MHVVGGGGVRSAPEGRALDMHVVGGGGVRSAQERGARARARTGWHTRLVQRAPDLRFIIAQTLTSFPVAPPYTTYTQFKAMAVSAADNNAGFTGTTKYGCKVSDARKKDYKATTYVIAGTAGVAGGVFRLPNS